MKPTYKQLRAELRRVTNFLDGICICTGPAASAFTRQQLAYVQRARKTLQKAAV